ncbi:MAG: RNA recognition motif domain-containing protein [Patescibacteria group bacterium]
MAKKLYVGGLPYSTTDEALRDHFAQAGTVASATVIIDKMSGRSKGFGFVEMSTDEEAQAAIDMFHGKEFGGRTLTVNEARPLAPRPPRSGGGFNRGGFGGGNSAPRSNRW